MTTPKDSMQLLDAATGNVLRSTPNPHKGAAIVCSFCGRPKTSQNVVIAGRAPGSAICDRCVKLGVALIKMDEEHAS